MNRPTSGRKSLLQFAVVLALGCLLAGCATTGTQIGQWFGPSAAAVTSEQPVTLTDGTARLILTDHYKIYTTISDSDMVNKIAQVMEGSFQAYQTLAPGVPPTTYRMQCFVFANRAQWSEFTSEQFPPAEAAIYLQINRGGYTRHDWYVAYYIGASSTLSVAAHEGWHQFAARHFKTRLPPFLEEGLATMFEGVKFRDGLPRFNLSINQSRAIALAAAIDHNSLWPLDQVIAMNAGQIVGASGDKIEAFYAQAWALGRFLWDGDNGAHRAALRQILLDTAHGVIYDPTGIHPDQLRGWSAPGVKAMLEHYLQMDFADIDAAYNRYIRHIAYDELPTVSDEPQ
jgi:hypothetical protein